MSRARIKCQAETAVVFSPDCRLAGLQASGHPHGPRRRSIDVWEIFHVDVQTAFLHTDVEGEIQVEMAPVCTRLQTKPESCSG